MSGFIHFLMLPIQRYKRCFTNLQDNYNCLYDTSNPLYVLSKYRRKNMYELLHRIKSINLSYCTDIWIDLNNNTIDSVEIYLEFL